jgi:farnesyl-diphosphate farnesyltransferase
MDLLKAFAQSAFSPAEISAMFQLKFGGHVRKVPKSLNGLSDIDFCYATLHKVSRSFAVVIQQLPDPIKDAICVFYLVLRGLDSVEDDMTLAENRKVPILLEFHDHMGIDGWHLDGIGDGPDYRVLLAHFDKVIRVYKALPARYRAVIKDITMRMGAGMAEFVRVGSMETVAQYDLYCHYVAGLVGYGLSDIFAASGLEDRSIADEHRLSNSMGLFLQKTNIVRDYLEDLREGRTWWPREIWGRYTESLQACERGDQAAMDCLNEMVTDSLKHVPDALDYLGKLTDPQIFRFCAIPQVMAIATLSAVYNNKAVFRQNVKIRKGLSARLMLETETMDDVHIVFYDFLRSIQARIPREDPSSDLTRQLVSRGLIRCQLSPSVSRRPVDSAAARLCKLAAWVLLLVGLMMVVFRSVPNPPHHLNAWLNFELYGVSVGVWSLTTFALYLITNQDNAYA